MTPHWQLQDSQLIISGALDMGALTDDGWGQLSKAQQAQLSAQAKVVMLFKHVEHVDSAGLAWVLNWIRDAKAHNVEFAMRDVPENLIQLARLSNVAELLPLDE